GQLLVNINGLTLDVIPYNEEQFVVGGVFRDARILVVDSTGIVDQRIGVDPTPEFGQPANYQGEVKLHPNGSRAVVATRNADVLAFYEVPSGETAIVWGPEQLSPSQERSGYRDVAVNSTHVFGLYSGRQSGEVSH